MLIICPNCLADETSFFSLDGGNFCSECGAILDHDGGLTPFRIVVDDTLPLGVMEFRHPDGRVDRIHTNFP